LIYCAPPSFKL